MTKEPTLYLSRTGLLEPLGQSQVMAYLRGLSRDFRITLISYEKAEDLADAAAMARARADCEFHGVRWLPQRFTRWPRVIAPVFSMLGMTTLAWREARRGNARLIHARSYVPAGVALVVWRLTGTSFLFDTRSLWPEELVTAGRLRDGSRLHRAIKAVERACLRRAAGVISTTHAAVDHLRKAVPSSSATARIVVIPTCADLDRFTPRSGPRPDGPRVHGCMGTILSGWFRTDWLAAWIAAAADRDPDALFDIVTRDDAKTVRAALDPESRLASRLTIGPRRPQEMPDVVRTHDLSVMFFTEGLSKLGSSPTRMAEVLGSGLPVVANAGVGDVARIVTEHRVGVLVSGPSPEAMAEGLAALEALMADPELPARCRAAAEALFSLRAGTEAYRALYREVLGEGDGTVRDTAAWKAG